MSLHNDAFYRLGLRVLGKLPSEGTGRVLLITSARTGEGKSFVSLALVKALAAQCTGPVALVQASGPAAKGGRLVRAGQPWPMGGGHGPNGPRRQPATDLGGRLPAR